MYFSREYNQYDHSWGTVKVILIKAHLSLAKV